MVEPYVYPIVALMPLAASMVVAQRNPYHALVLRGLLGAISALVYAVLGAADVALTEALVGTMLAITLYAVAVRSSLMMRLGVLESGLEGGLEPAAIAPSGTAQASDSSEAVLALPTAPSLAPLREVLAKHYLRLELIPYSSREALHAALKSGEVHAICLQTISPAPDLAQAAVYQALIRVRRLYEILQAERVWPAAQLTYVELPEELSK
jgi:putative multicomponent Na+:H+ antiporter subunit B